MRTITTAALLGHAMPDTDINHYQHQQYHGGMNPEPSWMHEQAAGEAAGAAAQPYPSAAATSHTHQNQHETTPLRGSAPSSVASSAGRPSKHGAMYRPYLRRQDIRLGCCLSIFLAINAVCVLSALSVAVAEILSIVYHGLSPLGIAIRVYGIVFSIGVVFTELGWTQVGEQVDGQADCQEKGPKRWNCCQDESLYHSPSYPHPYKSMSLHAAYARGYRRSATPGFYRTGSAGG